MVVKEVNQNDFNSEEINAHINIEDKMLVKGQRELHLRFVLAVIQYHVIRCHVFWCTR